MINERTIETERLQLRSLTAADVGERYLAWLADPVVTRFMEARYRLHTIETTRRFVTETNDSDHSLLLGIFLRNDGSHIGNIKLGPIEWIHRRADVGVMIGDRSSWGQGFATEAISALCEHAFEAIGLEKLQAGCYGDNGGSARAFAKAGFTVEGRLRSYWSADSDRQDQVLMGRAKTSRRPETPTGPTCRFGHVNRVVVIGGGDLMMYAARRLAAAGLQVTAVLAPRHAEEVLPFDRRRARIAIADSVAEVVVVEDINEWTPPVSLSFGHATLALCFGPAWIFSSRVRSWFGAGMINCNCIPIPRYLGAAHYTWQILNRDRTGAFVLQMITEVVDRGPILRAHRFQVPDSARTPEDYLAHNYREGQRGLDAFIPDMRAGQAFQLVPFDAFDTGRLFFPRLRTFENGYVDWAWTADEIVRFCSAFDAPYPGAGTFLDGREVRLSRVTLSPEDAGDLHPFAAGLIVRRVGSLVYVASRGGLLIVEGMVDRDGADMAPLAREGRRFITPPDVLHHSRTYRPTYRGT